MREALRITPGRPNFASGLRAGLATTLPLLLGPWLGYHELAWVSLAGFNTVLVDKGGAYRTRALAMLALALGGALVVTLGTSIAQLPWLSVPLVLAVVFVGGFLRLFGAEGTTLGIACSISFVLALSRPAASLHEALRAGGFFALGCAWSSLIALVLWPLRPFRPAARAVAASLLELSQVAESLVGGKVDQPAQVARRALLGHTREVIEASRAALGISRRARPGPSRRGEQLVALLEGADQLFAALTAIDDALASAPSLARAQKGGGGPEERALSGWIDAVARRIASELTRTADAVSHERVLEPRPAPRPSFATVAQALAPHAEAQREYLPLLLARAIERLELLTTIAREDPSDPNRPNRARPRDLSTNASWSSLVRDQLSLKSAIFRHALRMALSTALAVRITHELQLEHGYWATLTCIVIMQPQGIATWTKALQRVGGTVLGAGVAMLVASFAHEPVVIVACVFAFVSLGVSLLPINYGAHAVFLTPAFVLLAETQAGNIALAGVRVGNTLVGALIALAGSRLLFPLDERDQFRPLMGKAIAGLRGLLAVSAQPMPRVEGSFRLARQELGLALLNAEASYQRLLTESRIRPGESEALLSLLLYTHRMASGLIALALVAGSPAQQRLGEQERELMQQLSELEHAIRERLPPPARARTSLPPAGEQGERVEVLYEQLEVLREAARRWSAFELGPDVAVAA